MSYVKKYMGQPMELVELRAFIKAQAKQLKDYYAGVDEDKMILAGTVKLAEELGELCQEILAHQTLQRTSKLKHHNKDTLASEFADAIIIPLILAEWMNIDMEQALEHKIDIIKKRFSPSIKQASFQQKTKEEY